jgi:hypothetical protein
MPSDILLLCVVYRRLRHIQSYHTRRTSFASNNPCGKLRQNHATWQYFQIEDCHAAMYSFCLDVVSDVTSADTRGANFEHQHG